MRMRKKKNLPARMARCACLLEDTPCAHRGSWLKTFLPEAAALHVELGCGKGRFVCENAVRSPDTLFIAVERVPEVLVMAMEKAQQAQLKNVRFICGDAASLHEWFAPEEVSRIYINFCDPWPSNKHAPRRLTHRGFLTLYKKVLRPDGDIHFKTDNLPLFDFSLKEFSACGFVLDDVTNDLHAQGLNGVVTEYEEKFSAQGVLINRCRARLEENPVIS